MEHDRLVTGLRDAVLGGHGVTPAPLRQAAYDGTGLPVQWAAYVELVRDSAYRVGDRVVADLLASGASEDEVFEVTVAAAVGAASRGLESGLRALRGER